MSIVVTKCSSEFVRPCESAAGTTPTTGPKITRLSPFDKVLLSSPVSLLLVFDKKPPTGGVVETIKRGLSRALVYYCPFWGRLAAAEDDDGEEVITCGGEGEGGVLLVGASASCTVDDVSSSPALRGDLLAHYPEPLCRRADPLLLMQVTELSCGGLAVGVTWNHVLADAAGIGQFLQAVGEMARGMALPSVVPVSCRSDDRAVLAAQCHGIVPKEFLLSLQVTMGMAFLEMTIPSGLIARVKAHCGSCTEFEAAASLLWHCRARATASDDAPQGTLALSGNVRGLVGASRGYHGNCCVMESVQGAVANIDIKDVVDLVRILKKKIQRQCEGDTEEDKKASPPPPPPPGYHTLLVSSWRNLGLELADFGGGTPVSVMWYGAQNYMPFVVLCPPCSKGKDDVSGVNVMGYICKKEHLEAFMHEIQIAVSERLNVPTSRTIEIHN